MQYADLYGFYMVLLASLAIAIALPSPNPTIVRNAARGKIATVKSRQLDLSPDALSPAAPGMVATCSPTQKAVDSCKEFRLYVTHLYAFCDNQVGNPAAGGTWSKLDLDAIVSLDESTNDYPFLYIDPVCNLGGYARSNAVKECLILTEGNNPVLRCHYARRFADGLYLNMILKDYISNAAGFLHFRELTGQAVTLEEAENGPPTVYCNEKGEPLHCTPPG